MTDGKGEHMNKIKVYKSYIVFLLVLSVFIVLAMLVNANSIRLSSQSAEPLDECWEYSAYPTCVDLPATLNVSAGEAYTVRHVLSSDFNHSQVILIRTSLQNVEVALDDVVIYSVDYDDEATYASMWHLVDIPHDSSGQTLSLTFSSPYEAMSGTVNEVIYGSDLALHSSIVSAFGFRLFIGVFTLIIGLFIIIGSAVYKPRQSDGYAYVGMFAVLISFWVISESRMLQYFTGNIFIIGSISYLSLSVFPIPLLRYVRNHILKSFALPLSLLCGVFVINTGVILMLHFTGIADFFETVIVTQLLIGIGFIIVITALGIEYKKLGNKQTIRPLMLLGILFAFGMLEFVTFLVGDFDQTSIFLVTGLLIVMVLVIVRYVGFLRDRFRQGYEKEFYEKLAYVDPLTNAKNRLSFEKDLAKYFNHPGLRNTLRLIYFDLDNLKRINDDYGHIEGDSALKFGFSIIESVFGEYGSCYRIGGDEFACIALDLSDELYKEKQNEFETLFAEYKDLPYPIRMSIGSKVYENHLSLNAFIKHADQSMYKNKSMYKERD